MKEISHKDTKAQRADVKERPILFQAPMVRAVLPPGAKTQTRRLVKLDSFKESDTPGYDWIFRDKRGLWNDYRTEDIIAAKCPYGKPGDRLWVRENFQIESNFHIDCRDNQPPFSDGRPIKREEGIWEQCHYAATEPCPELFDPQSDECVQRWRPSIHMPRWASRITLEVTNVRVERLNVISGPDCWAEGIEHAGWDCEKYGSVTHCFEDLWESINGEGSWKENPWVWAVSFVRLP